MADTDDVSKAERVKAASNQLRGTIGEELSDAAPAFSDPSQQLLKFHGIYQQDDRDVRTERKRQGLGLDHICMVRVSIPGGILTAEQYLAMDALCDAVITAAPCASPPDRASSTTSCARATSTPCSAPSTTTW